MGAGSRISAAIKEPLLQFAAAGLILFLASWFFGAKPRTIVITPELRRALVAEREELLMRALTDEEREKLVSDYVDDEILLREAHEQRLDENDPRIRNWLVDKMKFLLDEEPEEPTQADLDALFQKEPDRYRTPRSVSFDHIFFANGSPPPAEAESVLSRLRAGADFQWFGDEFWLGRSLRRFSELELSGMLGKEFAGEVFALPVGEWKGPIRSSRGAHLVRVVAKHDPELPPKEEVLWAVKEDWLRQRREEIRGRKMAEIRAKYRIEIAP